MEVYYTGRQSAFLNADLDEELYVSQPQGSVSSENANGVYILRKAFYGSKQAS